MGKKDLLKNLTNTIKWGFKRFCRFVFICIIFKVANLVLGGQWFFCCKETRRANFLQFCRVWGLFCPSPPPLFKCFFLASSSSSSFFFFVFFIFFLLFFLFFVLFFSFLPFQSFEIFSLPLLLSLASLFSFSLFLSSVSCFLASCLLTSLFSSPFLKPPLFKLMFFSFVGCFVVVVSCICFLFVVFENMFVQARG